ncbi:dimethyl sulfoxide reductase anchor subunit family protein [Luteimonas changyuni]|uniref:dimethyl sulfoxide reductase anchor subunit family protein n=1 Tax=Luteimonas sp. MJ145 TaxID=3129234 RepID=UPI0031B9CABE
MHPALPAIFSTTLSGAGYGLLAWSGLTIALLALRGGLSPALEGVQLAGLGLGLLLSTIGLLCSLAQVGESDRSFSQWRSSWLSREGVLAVATAPLAMAAMALLLWMPTGATRAAWLACLGLLLAVMALATVACTAMVYASLKPIPAWRHPLVLPVYLLFALLTGLALQLVTMAAMLRGQGPAGMLPTLVLFGLVLAALKWLYWRAIDRDMEVSELARRHAVRLRWAALAGLVALPLLATLLMAFGWIPALAATLLAALGLLASAFAERWLLFAQARHVVSACC